MLILIRNVELLKNTYINFHVHLDLSIKICEQLHRCYCTKEKRQNHLFSPFFFFKIYQCVLGSHGSEKYKNTRILSILKQICQSQCRTFRYGFGFLCIFRASFWNACHIWNSTHMMKENLTKKKFQVKYVTNVVAAMTPNPKEIRLKSGKISNWTYVKW